MDPKTIEILPAIVLAVIAIVCAFIFVTMVVWFDMRRRGQDALYRSELMKKIVDSPGPAAEQVVAVLREEAQRKQRGVRDGLRLAGTICGLLGAGSLPVLIYIAEPSQRQVWPIALMLALVGLALWLHARHLAARDGG